MREPVLRPPEEAQRIAQVVPHGLAPAGDGDVQGALGVGGEGTYPVGDGVGRTCVVGQGSDVIERTPSVIP
jgi:hypothetical protein